MHENSYVLYRFGLPIATQNIVTIMDENIIFGVHSDDIHDTAYKCRFGKTDKKVRIHYKYLRI